MSFYSKISLLALLAAGTALGMELPPRLKAPGTSVAAQALNQPMIKVYSPTQQIDTIQRNYLEASVTLKNMLEDTDANQALVLPDSMIEDYLAIKDLLLYEHRLIAETTDEKTALDLLKSKTEQQLTAIANACQRFDLNKISAYAIKVLAEKLNTVKRKEECLRKGSFNLNWTPDVGKLVSKQLNREIKISDYYFLLHSFFQKKFNRKTIHGIFFNEKEYLAFIKEWDIKTLIKNRNYRIIDLTEGVHCYVLNEKLEIEKEFTKPENVCYVSFLLADKQIHFECDPVLLHKYDQIFINLNPEQIAYLDHIAQLDDQKKSPFHSSQLAKIEASLPDSFIKIGLKQNPYWWQRRSWLSKAALITGGVAATGLATWLGYKYFGKK